jgi:hypothetical protein
MKKLLFLLLLIAPLALVAQPSPSPCDSNYIRLFSRTNFDLAGIPCEKFVVIGAKYYDKIAQGYNLSRGIVYGQDQVLKNLQTQLELANRYSETLKQANDSANATINRFSDNIKGYDALLRQSTAENDRLVSKMDTLLKDLDKQHKREVRRAKWNGIAVGGVIGAVVGAVACLLLVN